MRSLCLCGFLGRLPTPIDVKEDSRTSETTPEGPSTEYLGTLVPKTIPLMIFGTRSLKYWVLGPSGCPFDHLLADPGIQNPGSLDPSRGPCPSSRRLLDAVQEPKLSNHDRDIL